MPAVSAALLDVSNRHAVFVERLKVGEARKLVPHLREMDREIRLRLSGEELTAYNRVRLEALLGDIDRLIDRILTRFGARLKQDLFEFAASEAAFEAKALTFAVQNTTWTAAVPGEAQIIAAVVARPLAVRGVQGGKLLDAFLADFTKAQKDAMVGAIRRGFYEGKTNAEVIREIRGTKARQYKDGILAITQRQGEAVVRTSMAHASSVARLETFAANADVVKEYIWLSTLDNRTSDICQGLSGTRWKYGEGPVPPAHVNCRSTIVAALDERYAFLREGATQSSTFGPVPMDETYFSWLKQQAAEFQDNVLGPIRGKLLRDGGLSAERFRQLRLDRNFQPLTLAEMQRLEPLAFKRAGIRLNPETGRVINAPGGR